MATLWCKPWNGALAPISKGSAEVLAELPAGVYRVEIKRDRNSKHHRLIMALLSKVARALNAGPVPTLKPWTTEGVLEWVKVAVGHVEIRRLTARDAKRYGTDVCVAPKSISFAAMDETEFREFADAALQAIERDLCPWLRDSDEWPDLEAILAHYRGEPESAGETA